MRRHAETGSFRISARRFLLRRRKVMKAIPI
jgi:hypothetical protein